MSVSGHLAGDNRMASTGARSENPACSQCVRVPERKRYFRGTPRTGLTGRTRTHRTRRPWRAPRRGMPRLRPSRARACETRFDRVSIGCADERARGPLPGLLWRGSSHPVGGHPAVLMGAASAIGLALRIVRLNGLRFANRILSACVCLIVSLLCSPSTRRGKRRARARQPPIARSAEKVQPPPSPSPSPSPSLTRFQPHHHNCPLRCPRCE